ELAREIKRDFVGNTSNTSYNNYYTQADNPELNLLLPYLNINFAFAKSYIFTGINYSIPDMSHAEDENYEGQLGYQMGFGTQLTQYVAVEVVHRWVNISASPVYHVSQFQTVSSYDISRYRDERRGLGILDDEDLGLNGFNLNLKVTF
ncbi:MAG: hypothetical protein KDD40_05790, partial [Bdellovibrionales bacterium]|nr:hypothetical protein [Bdellovibrionales bacterium]